MYLLTDVLIFAVVEPLRSIGGGSSTRLHVQYTFATLNLVLDRRMHSVGRSYSRSEEVVMEMERRASYIQSELF